MSKRQKGKQRKLSPGASMAASMGALALLSSVPVGAAELVIEEVIVTAQKRAENLQEVAAAVSVLGGDKLAEVRATQLVDYAAYMPGVNIASGGTPGQTSITLRGIAPIGAGAVVGTYIDDTPVGSSANWARATIFALDLMPYDVERVEVLRGPQGTLYGAGSMGGLLKYVLRDPDLSGFKAQFGMEGSNIEGADDLGWGVRGAVNLPLSDTIGIRASYFNQKTPGFVDNVLTGEEDENELTQDGGRAVLMWQPADNLSVKLAGTWQRIESDDNASMSLGITGIDPPRGTRSFGDLNVSHTLAQPFEKRVDYYSLTVNWDLGWADFVSASSYSDTSTLQLTDATELYGGLYPLVTGGAVEPGPNLFKLSLDLTKWTQEFRLASSAGGLIEWLAGVYYTEEDSENVQRSLSVDANGQPNGLFEPLFVFAEVPTTYREFAGFGNLTFKLTERFDLTAGLRWAKNDQDFRQISGGAILPTENAPGSSSEDVLTWALTPRWRFNDDVMAYFKVATGYRPGGPNVVLPGVRRATDADELINYELGFKSQFLDRRALLNVAAFFIDWSDIQQAREYSPGVSAADNVGEAESKGVELESAFYASNALRLGLNLAYTDTTLSAGAEGLDNTLGVQLPGVPEWSGSITADYNFTLGGRQAHIGAGFRHVGKQQTQVVTITNNTSFVLPSYEILDLNADVKIDRLTLRLFAKNLTDERAYTGASLISDGAASTILGYTVPVRIDATLYQPRTVGIGLDFEF